MVREDKMKNKTPEQQAQHFEMLCEVSTILNMLCITNILTGSALLGLYRDGELRPNCWGVTLTCFYDQIKPKEELIKNHLKLKGYKIEKHFINRNWKIRASKGQLQIEICGYSYNPDKKIYYRKIKNKIKFIPIEFLDKNMLFIKNCFKFKVPFDIKKYLKFTYKDWKTPVNGRPSPSSYKTKKHMVVNK
jgi:hypothetical protein